VNFLLDTHMLLWATGETHLLPRKIRPLLADPANELVYSAASIWEIAIKKSLGRPDFQRDLHVMQRGLRTNGYVELPVSSSHALAVATLPPIHKDPFDRLLIAQALVEGITLLTVDSIVARYPGPIRKV